MNVQRNADSFFEPSELRKIFGQFATGVTVVTTIGDKGAPVGLAANSFSSVSLDPPLVLWSIGLETPSLGAFRRHPAFAINILCDRSKDIAVNFAKPSKDKFSTVDWKPGLAGVPVLDQAASVIQCWTDSRIPGGDHEIYLGRVVEFRTTEKPPLVFHGGRYNALGDRI